MIRFVVNRAEESDELVKLYPQGLCDENHDYEPHRVVAIDASFEDVRWRPPPEPDSPLVGRQAWWDGRAFLIEAAYLKVHAGMILILCPLKTE
jgi:hypothetical protein